MDRLTYVCEYCGERVVFGDRNHLETCLSNHSTITETGDPSEYILLGVENI